MVTQKDNQLEASRLESEAQKQQDGYAKIGGQEIEQGTEAECHYYH